MEPLAKLSSEAVQGSGFNFAALPGGSAYAGSGRSLSSPALEAIHKRGFRALTLERLPRAQGPPFSPCASPSPLAAFHSPFSES